MEEEYKSTEVPLTIDQEVESILQQVFEDILPTVDEPDPIITLLGTLSILYNRIKWKNGVNTTNQFANLQIKMEDKFFYESALEQFCEILCISSNIVTF